MEIRPCSFSEQAVCALLASDVFYPSNVQTKRVEDKHAIVESIQGSDLDCKEIAVTWHRVGKTLRAALRAMAFVGIGMTISLGGAFYYSAQTAHASLRSDWKKAQEFATLFLIDLAIAGFTIGWIYTLYRASYLDISQTQAVKTWYGLSALGGGYLCTVSCDPTQAAFFLTPPSSRGPLCKTIALKNSFGIVSEKETLLTYDPHLDREDMRLTGHFAELMRQEALAALFKIQEWQRKEARKIPFTYPPSPQRLQASKQWLKEYTPLYTKVQKLSELLKKCLSVQSQVNMPPFPFASSYVAQFFQGIVKTPWEAILEDTKQALHPTTFDDLPPEYKQVKKRVLEGATPHEILGVSFKPSSGELKKAYRKQALFLHFDKLPVHYRDQLKEEANALYKCVVEAYHHLGG